MIAIVVRNRTRPHSSCEPEQSESHLPLWHRGLHLLYHGRNIQESERRHIMGRRPRSCCECVWER